MSSNTKENSGKKVIAVRKNYPGNRSDIGWKHGTDVDGNGRRVQCNYCAKIVHGGIYRFKNHLACTKIDVEACLNVPEEVRTVIAQIIFEAKCASSKRKKQYVDVGEEDDQGTQAQIENEKSERGLTNFLRNPKNSSKEASTTQSTMNQMFKKDLREEACQQVARFFYTSAIPFNCIKNPEFLKMCELIGKFGQGFKPPSYHEIREKYLKLGKFGQGFKPPSRANGQQLVVQ